jgi:hypothetical protein
MKSIYLVLDVLQTLFELIYLSLLVMNGAPVFLLCHLMVLIVALENAHFFL